MRKLTKYLLADFLTVFGVALLLITFAFSIGALYKAVGLMSKGLPVGIVGKFALYNLPYSLAFTIPISALFSTLLLFGRLSSDSEISALRSGGLSLWQISSPILLFAFGLVLVCLYINCFVYPRTTYVNKRLKQNLVSIGAEDPVKLLEEGRFIRDIPGYMIYVGKKHRNKVKDLIVYGIEKETDPESGEIRNKVVRTIRAESGVLSTDAGNSILKIDLFKVRIEEPDKKFPDDPAKTGYANFETLPIRINIDELTKQGEVTKNQKNMTIFELFYKIRNYPEEFEMWPAEMRAIERTKYRIDASHKIGLAVAAFTFVLIAIPLGIKSHRKESSMGMLMSLGVVFVYYMFIILSDALEEKPQFYPWLIPWIPIIAGQIGGILLIRRAN